ATDRATRVLLPGGGPPARGRLWRALARRTSLIELRDPSPAALAEARRRGLETLAAGSLLAVSIGGEDTAEVAALLADFERASPAAVVPVFVGALDPPGARGAARVRVVFGERLPDPAL